MIESNLALVFKSNVATKENFIDMLNREPRVLHISCHGISTNVFRNTINYKEHVENGNCLIFEKSTGEGELVSE